MELIKVKIEFDEKKLLTALILIALVTSNIFLFISLNSKKYVRVERIIEKPVIQKEYGNVTVKVDAGQIDCLRINGRVVEDCKELLEVRKNSSERVE